VGGTISHQIGWTEANPERARFLYARGHVDWGSPAAEELDGLNRELAAAYRVWMEPLLAAGAIRETSMLVMSALVNGPVHAIARRWLAGQLDRPLRAFADELTDASCAALAGRGRPVRSSTRSAPARGRVRLELFDADGLVVARGEAVALLEQAGAQAGRARSLAGPAAPSRSPRRGGRINPGHT
jgi:hypothetical protein